MVVLGSGNVNAVKTLLSFNADPTLTDDKGRAPIRVVCTWEYANPKNEEEIVRLLMQVSDALVRQSLMVVEDGG